MLASEPSVGRHPVVAYTGPGDEFRGVRHQPFKHGLSDLDGANALGQGTHHDPDLVLQIPSGLLHGSVRLMVMCGRVRWSYSNRTGPAHFVNYVLHEGPLGRFTVGLQDASADS